MKIAPGGAALNQLGRGAFPTRPVERLDRLLTGTGRVGNAPLPVAAPEKTERPPYPSAAQAVPELITEQWPAVQPIPGLAGLRLIPALPALLRSWLCRSAIAIYAVL